MSISKTLSAAVLAVVLASGLAYGHNSAPPVYWSYTGGQAYSFLGGPYFGGPSDSTICSPGDGNAATCAAINFCQYQTTTNKCVSFSRKVGGVNRTMSHRQGNGTGNGDFDGNGYMDIALGQPYYDNGTVIDAGRVIVIYGGPNGPGVSPAKSTVFLFAPGGWSTADRTKAMYGSWVGSIGDVDNNGVADLLVTAPGAKRSVCSTSGTIYTDNYSPTSYPKTWIKNITGSSDPTNDTYRCNGPNGSEADQTEGGVNCTGLGNDQGLCTYYDAQCDWDSGTSLCKAGAANNTASLYNATGIPVWDNSPGSLCDGLYVNTSTNPPTFGTVTEDACSCPQGGAMIHFGSGSGVNPSAEWILPNPANEGYAKPINGGNNEDEPGGKNETGFRQTDDCGGGANVCEGLGNTAAALGDISVNAAIGSQGVPEFAIGYQVYDEHYEVGYVTPCSVDKGNQGRVYIFQGSPYIKTWVDRYKPWKILRNPTGAGCEDKGHFGSAIAAGDFDGDGVNDVVISADHFEAGDANNEGKVWLYSGNGLRLSTEQGPNQYDSDLTPDDYTQGDDLIMAEVSALGECDGHFGSYLAATDVNGDGKQDLLVGAPDYGHVNTTSAAKGEICKDIGASGYGDTPGQNSKCSRTNVGQEQDEGAVFVYHGTAPGGLNLTPTSHNVLLNPTDDDGAEFGMYMGVQGDMNDDGYGDLSVGADHYGATKEGRVYHFKGSSTGLASTPAWTLSPTTGLADSEYGRTAIIGDVDKDGFNDLLSAATSFSGTYKGEGKAFIHRGGVQGVVPTSAVTVTQPSPPAVSEMGTSVLHADVNGDYLEELFMGAPGTASQIGRVYYQNAANSGLTPQWTYYLSGETVGSRFGQTLAKADFNQDGVQDIIVAAPSYDSGGFKVGKIYLFRGILSLSPPIIETSITWSATGTSSTDAYFGTSLAVGDYNGDGWMDLAVGAPGSATHAGSVSIFLNTKTGTNFPAAANKVYTDTAGRDFGRSVVMADLNRDKFADVVVGEPLGVFKVKVFRGTSSATFPTSFQQEITGTGASFGWSIAPIGDLDQDGYTDIAVGHPQASSGGFTQNGTVYVYRGTSLSTNYLNPSVFNTISPVAQSNAWAGYSVAYGGDLNGDGRTEILIGAPYYDQPSAANAGLAIVSSAHIPAATVNTLLNPPINQTNGLFGLGLSSGDVHGDRFSDFAIGLPIDYLTGGRVTTYTGGDGTPGIDRKLRQFKSIPNSGYTYLPLGANLYASPDDCVSFNLRSIVTAPSLGALIRFEVEVRAVGTPFTGTATNRSTIDTALNVPRSGDWMLIQECNLTAGAYKWRARVVNYTNSNTLGESPNGVGRWLDFGDNGNDADFIRPN